MIDKIGFLIIVLILFICFNGLIIRWDKEAKANRKAMWSKWWHRCALAIRVCIWTAIWMITLNWYILIGVVVIDCILYPIGINIINELKWYYVGTTSKIDILIRKILSWLKVEIK